MVESVEIASPDGLPIFGVESAITVNSLFLVSLTVDVENIPNCFRTTICPFLSISGLATMLLIIVEFSDRSGVLRPSNNNTMTLVFEESSLKCCRSFSLDSPPRHLTIQVDISSVVVGFCLSRDSVRVCSLLVFDFDLLVLDLCQLAFFAHFSQQWE